MMPTIRSLAYLIASLLFIMSLRGLSTQETARGGNRNGVIGMLIAVIMTAVALLVPVDFATASTPDASLLGVLGGALIIGLVVEVSPVLGMPGDFKYATAMLILILLLLVRPQGLLGKPQRIG